ncbi:MAG: M24 family metallopeptidase, partial [Chloroflexota bacterium]
MATATTMTYPRADRLRQALRAAGIDLLALAPTNNLRYILGGFAPPGDERFCALLVTADGIAMVIPSLNLQQAREHLNDVPFYDYADEAGPSAALAKALRFLQAAQAPIVAVDEEMYADHLLVLQAVLPTATYRRAGEVVAPLRSRKDAAEIELLKAAAATADAGVRAVYEALRPGITEVQLVDVAGTAMRRAGADAVAFAGVGAGAHSALPHHHPDQTALRAGDVVFIDIGSTLNGYCSDITRMAIVGGAAPDPEFERVRAVVEAAVRAALDTARPGVAARAVDAAAREVITAAGYGENFVHRTGHGLGLSVHEPPYITSTEDLVLDEGMVFSIEPGIY